MEDDPARGGEVEHTVAMSAPMKAIDPAVTGKMPETQRAMVDLPHPDSPTNANVVPCAIAKLTSSTAGPPALHSP